MGRSRQNAEDAMFSTTGGRNTNRRQVKQAVGAPKTVKEKFVEQRQEAVVKSPLVPMNDLQKQYIDEIRDKSLVVATGYAGTSKCVRKNTLIRTPKGLVEIGDLFNTDGEEGYFDFVSEVVGLNGVEQTSKFFVEHDSEVLKLVTKQGYELVATPEHPVYVFDGLVHKFKKLSEITSTDTICIERSMTPDTDDEELTFNLVEHPRATNLKKIKVPTKMDKNLGKWLGYVIANGATSVNAVHWTSNNVFLAEDYIKLTKQLFDVDVRKYDAKERAVTSYLIHSKHVVDVLNSLCGNFETARFKDIPRSVLASSKDVKKAFITSMLDCDGSFLKNGVMEFSTASEDMARQMQVMLLEFGIVSRKFGKCIKGMGDHLYWKVSVASNNVDILFQKVLNDTIKYKNAKYSLTRNTNIDVIWGVKSNLKALLEEGREKIGWKKSGQYLHEGNIQRLLLDPKGILWGCKELTYQKLEELLFNYENESPYIKDVFKEYGSLLRKIAETKFFYDKVEDIQYAGVETVYDLTVPDTHSFVSNGFISHNTYIPTVMACDMFLLGEIDRIYLTRPNISNSKSLGYFQGDHITKLSMWLGPVLSTLRQRLGANALEIAVKNQDIVFVPMEVIKGYSFGERTFVIVDEAEDLSVEEAKKIVTRMGGCKMVLAGDILQSELKEKSGLLWLKNMVEKYPELESHTGSVDFNRPSDIVRSKECREWILAMRREGEM